MNVKIINGWKEAPHQWWRYLLLPFGWDRFVYQDHGQVTISLFGFAFVIWW
jgi:hypothetical protein